MAEEFRRQKLREIEVKVVQYQDELESGKRALKPGWTVSEQIEHHRKKLLRKVSARFLKKRKLYYNKFIIERVLEFYYSF